MNSEKVFKYVKFLAFLGIILAIYLLWQQFFKPDFQPCSINEKVNCDAVISGPVSKTLGVATPIYGLVGYIVILISAILKKKKLLLATAIFGSVFCLRIAFIELFQLNVICPVCILCQIIMIITFGFSVYLVKKKPDEAGS